MSAPAYTSDHQSHTQAADSSAQPSGGGDIRNRLRTAGDYQAQQAMLAPGQQNWLAPGQPGTRRLGPASVDAIPKMGVGRADADRMDGASPDLNIPSVYDIESQGDRSAYPEWLTQLLDRWPDGIAMTFYADHFKAGGKGEEGKAEAGPDETEIIERGIEQAGLLGSVGKGGGGLALGVSHAITSKADIITVVQAVSDLLKGALNDVDRAAGRHKVAQLHIYTHGGPTTAGTDAGRESRKDALTVKSAPQFVGAISDYLRGDVNVAMFACSTGSGADGSAGEGSLADTLRDSLSDDGHEDATVNAHTVRGHTSGNMSIRNFGGDFGGRGMDVGGASFIDMVFAEPLRAEVAADRGVKPDRVREKLKIWTAKYVKRWRQAKKGERVYLGFVCMTDPQAGARILREAFAQTSGWKDYSPRPEVDYQALGVEPPQ